MIAATLICLAVVFWIVAAGILCLALASAARQTADAVASAAYLMDSIAESKQPAEIDQPQPRRRHRTL